MVGWKRIGLLTGAATGLVALPAGLAIWLAGGAPPSPGGAEKAAPRPARPATATPDYDAHRPPPPRSAPRTLPPRLGRLLDQRIVRLRTVPRVFLTRLPDQLPEMDNAQRRKRVFVTTLLPIVLRANELIRQDRRRILDLLARRGAGGALPPTDRAWLDRLAKTYRLDRPDRWTPAALTMLLKRVDIVPPSLTVAQAAMESGWGTSHFSQNGNALFGEWTWDPDAKGLMPRNRAPGKTHRIRAFDYLLESVLSYMRNLNRHPAYDRLRARRAELRQHGLAVSGPSLAPALQAYSERGEAYVNDILSIIAYNGFAGLDSLRLARRGDVAAR